MVDEDKPKKSKRKNDRPSLDLECLEKIDAWIDQLRSSREGIFVNRKQLINELIRIKPGDLSSKELRSLGDKFYDPAKFLKQLLNRANEAKKQGKKFEASISFRTTQKIEKVKKKEKVEETISESGTPK